MFQFHEESLLERKTKQQQNDIWRRKESRNDKDLDTYVLFMFILC